MKPRQLARPSLLLFAAFCWLASPSFVSAGPGQGGHGGGGHAGGGGGHSGGYASSSAGHAPAASSSHYSAPAAPASRGYSGSYVAAPAGVANGSLSSFAPSSGSGSSGSVMHNAATSAALSQLAAHGWSFTPSSGVARPVVPSRMVAQRPSVATPVLHAPVVVPSHGLRPRPPFATTVVFYRPFYGFGFGGGPCINNGFTTVCGFGPAFYLGSFYGNGGYGYGGYGYEPDYMDGYGSYGGGYYGGEPNLPVADDLYPQNSGRMDIYGGYIGNAPAGSEDAEPTVPAAPPTQIVLKSGAAFAVKAYWVSDGELYYRPVTGGLSHVPLEQLDLAATVQANSRNNVPFTLSERSPQ